MGKPQDVLVPRTIASLRCFTEWNIHRRSGLTQVRKAVHGVPQRLSSTTFRVRSPSLSYLCQ
jgi:hypothetical protein